MFWEPCLGEHTFLPWESRTKQPDKWIRNPGQPLCSWSRFLHFRGLWRLMSHRGQNGVLLAPPRLSLRSYLETWRLALLQHVPEYLSKVRPR